MKNDNDIYADIDFIDEKIKECTKLQKYSSNLDFKECSALKDIKKSLRKTQELINKCTDKEQIKELKAVKNNLIIQKSNFNRLHHKSINEKAKFEIYFNKLTNIKEMLLNKAFTLETIEKELFDLNKNTIGCLASIKYAASVQEEIIPIKYRDFNSLNMCANETAKELEKAAVELRNIFSDRRGGKHRNEYNKQK